MVGRDQLPPDFVRRVDDVPLMESVHMVHLGVKYDTLSRQPGPLCYYYGTYDVEDAVRRCQSGAYHEGKRRIFDLCALPSLSGDGAQRPPCRNHLHHRPQSTGPWQLGRTPRGVHRPAAPGGEKIMPGLRRNTRVMEIMTPVDFCRRTHLKHHAFGGRAPVMGKSGGPHQTPVQGLWFVGSPERESRRGRIGNHGRLAEGGEDDRNFGGSGAWPEQH